MAGHRPVWIVLLLATAGTPVWGAKEVAKTQCQTFGPEPSFKICTQLDESALSRGGSTRWRVWVDGERRPSRLRLHNVTPWVIEMDKGPDQIVDAAGPGRPIVRRVSILQPGVYRLSARPYDEDPRKESVSIAETIAPALESIAADFHDRRSRLRIEKARGGRPAYLQDEVLGLLSETEKALLGVLAYPELGAMRDAVTADFRQAREALAGKGVRRAAGPGDPDVAPAFARAFAPRSAPVLARTGGGLVLQEAGDAALDLIGRTLGRATGAAAGKELILDLCVVSLPVDGAKFLMHTLDDSRPAETLTAGKLSSVYRGDYAYEIKKKGHKTIGCRPKSAKKAPDCSLLDLWRDNSPVFECDFTAEGCRRLGGPLPQECQRHDG